MHKGVVLVTGATGFIGAELTARLEQRGHVVVKASREIKSGASCLKLPSADAPASAFEAVLEDVDHVVHLAGIHHPKREVSFKEYWSANCLLTTKLAKAAHRKIPGKFVFTSSVRAQCGSVYDGILREEDPPQPTDDYGMSKLAAEMEIAA